MINSNSGPTKGSNDYLESIRQKIGYGHSDKAETREAKKELGKDDFIKLMSTQLKYQDPTSPLKNEEMAAQLAQFSSLEQMSNVNRNLEKMSSANGVRDSMAAASLIGKSVQTDASHMKLTEDRNSNVEFSLPEPIAKGKVAVVDSKGTVVREILLEKMDKGKQTLKWDGRNEQGSNAPLGDYSFRVTAYDASGKKIEASTSTTGIVTGVEFDKGKPVLLVGAEKIPMEVVSKIEDLGAAGTSAPMAAKASVAAKLPNEQKSAPVKPAAVNGLPMASIVPEIAKQENAIAPVAETRGPKFPNGLEEQRADAPMVIEDSPMGEVAAPRAPRSQNIQKAPLGEPQDPTQLAGTALWNPTVNGVE